MRHLPALLLTNRDGLEAIQLVRLERANGMVNEVEVRTVAGAWARVLGKAPDEAQGIQPWAIR
jgi:hypothetical protein